MRPARPQVAALTRAASDKTPVEVRLPPGMSKTTAVFGKHTIELSNLDKVLFPEDGIVKAELIEYYLKIAPTILRHIKGRPLSLVRYPDGVGGTAEHC